MRSANGASWPPRWVRNPPGRTTAPDRESMNHLLDDQPGQPLTREQLERVQAETFVEYIEFHERISSTNDRALQLAGELVGARPLLVIANHQSGGRGRGKNQWWASPGSLTFSLVLDAAAVSLPPRSWPLVSLTVGLAVCEALEESTLR